MKNSLLLITPMLGALVLVVAKTDMAAHDEEGMRRGRRLFETETFLGNGRTCLTCHSRETGTVSPEDARKRFKRDPSDRLFVHDGSDDGSGSGVSRMLNNATVRVEIALHPGVYLADAPSVRSLVLHRGIPSTLNTPALDPVLMWDGRARDLASQAEDAIRGHAQSPAPTPAPDIAAIADFERRPAFFSSDALRRFAKGGPPPRLPEGRTSAEKRGRRFFGEVPLGPDNAGVCAVCHSGPMLNETNAHIPAPVPPGTRFESAFVSELNKAKNPVRKYVFTKPDGTAKIVESPDPGRALITGDPNDINDFKIPSLYGIRSTAPYFHDNSAATLEDVAAHYKEFFEVVTDADGPGGAPALVVLSDQDKADMVAFMKLLK